MDWQLVTQSLGGGILTGSVYGVAAVGLALVFGVVGVVNFAHGAMIMLGMYVVWYLHQWTSLDPFLLSLVAAVVGLGLGWFIQYVLVNKVMGTGQEGPLLVTVGISLIFVAVAEFVFSSNPRSVKPSYGDATFSVGPAQFSVTRLIAMLAAVAFTLALHNVLRKTDLGRSIRAVSQNRTAAQLMGLNVATVYAAAMALGAASAFFAGGVSASLLPVTPNAGLSLMLMSFVAAVLGGLGSIRGAFAAGIIVGLAEGAGALLLEGTLKTLVVFALFVLVLLLRPEGVFKR
ncbi:branched-chain amino acid ABC transporter permease [Streptosporangium violaceochromogenes]|nr:branched-chain amino acid ABC transporter permease [Streptosporangium violaceochromogenes]